MPVPTYGVLVGRAVAGRRATPSDATPHFQIELVDDGGTRYRVAVNVKSAGAPSEVLYVVDDDFHHPILGLLPGPGSGWTPLAPGPGGPNLDFVRGNLFDPADLRPLPPDAPGSDNDLADLLGRHVGRAVGDALARVHVLGARFGPEPGARDKVFGFTPENGVHDVHMNQGNVGPFVRDDGVWQDGGLLLHFPTDPRWVAIFLAFQSQAWHTDDVTGHTVGATRGTGATGRSARVRGPGRR